ncbi:LOW QUALITY PROTEIN: uridine diphosphate glucose pyrophosphatase NUDT14 [Choloepus didactylus]|uniref:LOW QUALITY PROTEIN: uridine diphosphate glucose pyrophosphatase NUDT14 n=1 Tax=Choloepus didactylus TaxID=27675 RepID=UPI00189E8FB9|nr:LOW QUALITY PROTEIN: uridine diphosphate glucose pyrophosphatase NUDT14 [Choloepus didactylus]
MERIEGATVGPCAASPYLRSLTLRYRQDSVQKSWDFMKTHDSVTILMFNTTRRSLVLVKQFRPAVYVAEVERCFPGSLAAADRDPLRGLLPALPGSAGVTYELCAGLVDQPGLSLEDVACKEAWEECGYRLAPCDLRRVATYNPWPCGARPGQQLLLTDASTSCGIKHWRPERAPGAALGAGPGRTWLPGAGWANPGPGGRRGPEHADGSPGRDRVLGRGAEPAGGRCFRWLQGRGNGGGEPPARDSSKAGRGRGGNGRQEGSAELGGWLWPGAPQLLAATRGLPTWGQLTVASEPAGAVSQLSSALPPEASLESPQLRSGVGLTGSNQTMFYAEVTDALRSGPGGGLAEEGELIEVMHLPLDGAQAFADDPNIPKTLGVIFGISWFLSHVAPGLGPP